MWLEAVLGLCLGCEIYARHGAPGLARHPTTRSRSVRTARASYRAEALTSRDEIEQSGEVVELRVEVVGALRARRADVVTPASR